MPSITITRARCLLAVVCALGAWQLLLPGTAAAAMTIDSGPNVRVSAHQVTIWWHSSSTGSSELRWDTSNRASFASFANDVSNTSTTLGTVHSRTISNLDAGTYFFQARTTGAAGTATSSTHSFVVDPVNAVTPFGALVFDGITHASAFSTDGSTLYVGGEFTRVQDRTGSVSLVDPATGAVRPGTPQFWGRSGYDACWMEETEAVADGAGGWYVVGEFDRVGGLERNGVARLLPDGGIDPYWNPELDDTACTILLRGSTVYVGGAFTTVNGSVPRDYLAAFEAAGGTSTGKVLPFDAGLDGSVWTLAADATRLYAGGTFSLVNGSTPRNALASLDPTTGLANAWNPDPSDAVFDLVVNGTTVYAAGWFTTVNGATARNRLAAFDTTTGVATGWDPNVGGEVLVMRLDGTTLYLGGVFSALNGGAAPRNNLAAVNLTTGAATAWNPDANNIVHAMEIEGAVVYVGGRFTTINGGTSRLRAAALDKATGTANAWNPVAGGNVDLLLSQGGDVLIGGEFAGLGGQVRNRIAAIDTATGDLKSFDPNVNGTVYTLAVDGATTLYAGGAFTTVNGATARGRGASFNTSTGTANAWNPTANDTIYTIHVNGTTVYAGGRFTSVNGAATRNRIGAFNNTTGVATAWNPNVNGVVQSIRTSGTNVYAVGAFTGVNTTFSTVRNRIAAFDSGTAVATSFDPNLNNDAYSLALSGGTLYVGGKFTTVNGATPRNYVAAVSTATGTATAWNAAFGAGFSSSVRTIVPDGTRIYLGGNFGKMAGANYYSDFIALDATTAAGIYGTPEVDAPSNGNAEATGSIRTIATRAGGTYDHLFIGGRISHVGLWHEGTYPDMVPQANGALFRRATAVPDGVGPDAGALTITQAPTHVVAPYQTTISWTTNATSSSELVFDRVSRATWSMYQRSASNTGTALGTTHSRTLSNLGQGTWYYRVRSRDAAGNQVTSAERSFVVDPPNAATPLGSVVAGGNVDAIATSGGRTFIAGEFEHVGERVGSGVELDPVNAERRVGLPQVNGDVESVWPDGSGGWYVAGSFTHVGGLPRDDIAHLLPDGGVDPAFTPPSNNGSLRAVAMGAGVVYIAGTFTTLDSTPRARLAALDATSGALLAGFDPGAGTAGGFNTIYDLELVGARLYVAGDFTSYDGVGRARIAAVNASTGALDAGFNPGTGASGIVYDIDAGATRLYLGGIFTTFNGQARGRVAAVDLATGALDATFVAGTGADSAVHSIAASATRVYISGFFSTYNGTARAGVAAINATSAAIDLGFNPGSGLDSARSATAIEVAGALVYLGGTFSTYNGVSRPRVAAVNATTGALDATFAPGTGFDSSVDALSSAGGRLYVGGSFSTYRSYDRRYVAAIDSATGEVDAAFNPGTSANAPIEGMTVSGSRVYVSGTFSSVQGTARTRIAALNATTGAIDLGFNPGTGLNLGADTLLVSGTRLYLAGSFSSYNGTARAGIAAVDAATGAIDLGFNPGTGFTGGTPRALVVANSKLYVGGAFTAYNGQPRLRLAALNLTTAALDGAFVPPGTGPSSTVSALAAGGGRIYIGGSFTSYDGVAAGRVAAVDDATAALDTSFATTVGAGSPVTALALVGSQLYIGGSFTTVDGVGRNRLAALDTTTGSLDTAYDPGAGVTNTVNDLVATGTVLAVGGDFGRMDVVSQRGVALISVCDRSTYCADEGLRDYVTISAPSSVAVPSTLVDASGTGTLAVSVQSNALFGYSLLATDTSDTDALSCGAGNCSGANVVDWSGTGASPTTWPDTGANYGFGYTVLGSTLAPKDTARWGTGTTATDFTNNRYAGLDATTSTTLHATDRYLGTTADVTTIGLRGRVGPTQLAGTYGGTLSLTAVANP